MKELDRIKEAQAHVGAEHLRLGYLEEADIWLARLPEAAKASRILILDGGLGTLAFLWKLYGWAAKVFVQDSDPLYLIKGRQLQEALHLTDVSFNASLQDIAETFDLIVFNGPHLNAPAVAQDEEKNWVVDEGYKRSRSILEEALPLLADDGALVVTCSDLGDPEVFCQQVLAAAGAAGARQLILTIANVLALDDAAPRLKKYRAWACKKPSTLLCAYYFLGSWQAKTNVFELVAGYETASNVLVQTYRSHKGKSAPYTAESYGTLEKRLLWFLALVITQLEHYWPAQEDSQQHWVACEACTPLFLTHGVKRSWIASGHSRDVLSLINDCELQLGQQSREDRRMQSFMRNQNTVLECHLTVLPSDEHSVTSHWSEPSRRLDIAIEGGAPLSFPTLREGIARLALAASEAGALLLQLGPPAGCKRVRYAVWCRSYLSRGLGSAAILTSLDPWKDTILSGRPRSAWWYTLYKVLHLSLDIGALLENELLATTVEYSRRSALVMNHVSAHVLGSHMLTYFDLHTAAKKWNQLNGLGQDELQKCIQQAVNDLRALPSEEAQDDVEAYIADALLFRNLGQSRDLVSRFVRYIMGRLHFLADVVRDPLVRVSRGLLGDVLVPLIENSLWWDYLGATEGYRYRSLSVAALKLRIRYGIDDTKVDSAREIELVFGTPSRVSTTHLGYPFGGKDDQFPVVYRGWRYVGTEELQLTDFCVLLPTALGEHALWCILEQIVRNACQHDPHESSLTIGIDVIVPPEKQHAMLVIGRADRWHETLDAAQESTRQRILNKVTEEQEDRYESRDVKYFGISEVLYLGDRISGRAVVYDASVGGYVIFVPRVRALAWAGDWPEAGSVEREQVSGLLSGAAMPAEFVCATREPPMACAARVIVGESLEAIEKRPLEWLWTEWIRRLRPDIAAIHLHLDEDRETKVVLSNAGGTLSGGFWRHGLQCTPCEPVDFIEILTAAPGSDWSFVTRVAGNPGEMRGGRGTDDGLPTNEAGWRLVEAMATRLVILDEHTSSSVGEAAKLGEAQFRLVLGDGRSEASMREVYSRGGVYVPDCIMWGEKVLWGNRLTESIAEKVSIVLDLREIVLRIERGGKERIIGDCEMVVIHRSLGEAIAEKAAIPGGNWPSLFDYLAQKGKRRGVFLLSGNLLKREASFGTCSREFLQRCVGRMGFAKTVFIAGLRGSAG